MQEDGGDIRYIGFEDGIVKVFFIEERMFNIHKWNYRRSNSKVLAKVVRVQLLP